MAFVILVVPLDLLMILEDLARQVQLNMRVVHLILKYTITWIRTARPASQTLPGSSSTRRLGPPTLACTDTGLALVGHIRNQQSKVSVWKLGLRLRNLTFWSEKVRFLPLLSKYYLENLRNLTFGVLK